MNLKERREKLLEDIQTLTTRVGNDQKSIERMIGAVAIIDEQLKEEKPKKDKK